MSWTDVLYVAAKLLAPVAAIAFAIWGAFVVSDYLFTDGGPYESFDRVNGETYVEYRGTLSDGRSLLCVRVDGWQSMSCDWEGAK